MTETELLHQVLAYCTKLGLDAHHCRYYTADRGFPDLVIIGRHILFRELKNANAAPSAAQRRLGWRLRAAGADWAIWRPGDWHSGRIKRELLELA